MIGYDQFWILSICLMGAVQCLFLACYFALLRKGDRLPHRLMALLMLVLGVRLLKSGWYVFDGDGMSLLAMNLGFAAHLAVGPLLLLYLRARLRAGSLSWQALWHFWPCLLVILNGTQLELESFWYRGGYHTLLLYAIGYWLWAGLWLFDHYITSGYRSKTEQLWIISLYGGIGIFLLGYFSNYVLRIIPYAIAPMLYSVAVFPLSLSAWFNYRPPVTNTKYRNLRLPAATFERHQKKISTHLAKNKPYLEPGFTLSQLAEQTSIPAHVLSLVLNQHMQSNFSALINSYRVEYACELLRRRESRHLTIAAIAYEAGFNSLSVFNHTFKKRKGITPSAYRKAIVESERRSDQQ